MEDFIYMHCELQETSMSLMADPVSMQEHNMSTMWGRLY